MVTPQHFIAAGDSVALNFDGRESFCRAYELRMDSFVAHPLFDYRASYRRLLEIQPRPLAPALQGASVNIPFSSHVKGSRAARWRENHGHRSRGPIAFTSNEFRKASRRESVRSFAQSDGLSKGPA